jgi:hypothetical protein
MPGAEKEEKYKSIPLERGVGFMYEPATYNGFDIVIPAVGNDLCLDQTKFADAAFEKVQSNSTQLNVSQVQPSP